MSTDPKQLVCELAQECIEKFPVIILGSGASAEYKIPDIFQLKQHLLDISFPDTVRPDEANIWKKFLTKLNAVDLETALDEVRLPESLTELVVNSTWDFLAPFDYQVFEKAVLDHNLFPLTRLFRHLFNSTHGDIDVVTPNYDHIAEYAAEAGGLVHYTGFNYGHIRSRAIDGKPQICVGNSVARTVNIWKVHGSLDWFRGPDGVVIGLPVSKSRLANLSPVIVTPGIEKYRLTHNEPFLSIKTAADKVLQNAGSYLCIGYGFNDNHLQTTLVERCKRNDVPLVLLTKKVSAAAKEFFQKEACRKYLAVEESSSGCCIYSAKFPGGENIDSDSIWQLDEFLKLVIS